MTGDAQGLLAVATSIADGQDVDWQGAEAGLRSDHERTLLRSLRVIASIGELHRSTDSDPDDDLLIGAGGRLLPPRGRIVGRIGPITDAAAGDAPASSIESSNASPIGSSIGSSIAPAPSRAPSSSDSPASSGSSGSPASPALPASSAVPGSPASSRASSYASSPVPPAPSVAPFVDTGGSLAETGFAEPPAPSSGSFSRSSARASSPAATGPAAGPDWADSAAAPGGGVSRDVPRSAQSGAQSGAAGDLPHDARSGAPASADDPAAASLPERWGALVIRGRVGAGVFGEVYRAYDEQLQREVALKLLRAGTRPADRLVAKVLHEGRLLARVRHPNVVLVHGVEARGDRVGLWMEFIRGGTLEELLARQGLFGAREAALIGQDLCRALAAVHAAGLVHRDVKAQNVMREEGGRVVLMDFGTGVPVRDDESAAAAPAAGTPLYLAPELLQGGEATPASDLYSLGVLLYHVVTGTYPVTAASLAALRDAHARGRRRLHDARPDLPDAFVQAVDRALAPDPAERYASAGALQDALTRALGVDVDAPAFGAPGFGTPASGDQTGRTNDAARGLIGSAAPAPADDVAALAGRGTLTAARQRRGLLALLLVGGLAAAAGGWLLQRWWRTPAPGPIDSIVVLPLANVSSADRDLAEGMSVLIAEQLATLPALRVVHYTASMATRDQGLAVSEIIRRAQTDAAISGSVDWTGTRAHVFLQVVRAGASTPIWVKQIDVPARRAAELPRSVARYVAGALGVTLSPADALGLSGTGSSQPEAFEAYLRARVNMRAATIPAVKLAIDQLQDALRRDPAHAPSLAALADCYIVQAVAHRVRPLAEAGALAREAAERALRLDSELAEAYQALADLHFYMDWDWVGAETAYKRAVAYRPNSGDLRSRYAMFLAARKRLPDAMQEVHQAVALDPTSPLANASLGMLWHYARSDDQAERIYRGVLETDPTFFPARMGLIRTYVRTRRFDLALTELERNRVDAGGVISSGQQSFVGLAYAGLGRVAEARTVAEDLVRLDGDLPSVDAASVFIALDERDRALSILERAVAEKSPKVLFLRLDPRFDALLNEPRFRGLLRQMGFPS